MNIAAAITVALHPSVITQLSAKYGMPPQDYFIDKKIVINGEAKRVKIAFTYKGKPTNKYYYQTHTRLMDISQLKVLNEKA